MHHQFESILAAIERLIMLHPDLAPRIDDLLARLHFDCQGSARSRDMTETPSSSIFANIYEKKAWGVSLEQDAPFFSGRGSHEKYIVDPYVAAVKDFFSCLKIRPSVLDIGCGDFNVGSRLVGMCSSYTACDVVPSLIDYNIYRFKDLNVDFRVLDFVEDEIPTVDVIFVRQVFQHLSNSQISNAIKKISVCCRYLIVTEHLPKDIFTSNHDKLVGEGIRLNCNSGVVLTDAPFNLHVASQKKLCTVVLDQGKIETIVYEMKEGV